MVCNAATSTNLATEAFDGCPAAGLAETRVMSCLVLILLSSLGFCSAALPPQLLVHQNFTSNTNSSLLLPSSQLLVATYSGKMDSKTSCQCSEKVGKASHLREGLELLDAGFFNDTKILEIAKGAKEFNIPILRANRRLVASADEGLHYHSPLVFNPEWRRKQSQNTVRRFSVPSKSGIRRPESEEDIAFMSVLELGELIKSKQITSEELTKIFLERLKRYNPVLEAVVTYTEELAFRQAKEADKLFSRGVYLVTSHLTG